LHNALGATGDLHGKGGGQLLPLARRSAGEVHKTRSRGAVVHLGQISDVKGGRHPLVGRVAVRGDDHVPRSARLLGMTQREGDVLRLGRRLAEAAAATLDRPEYIGATPGNPQGGAVAHQARGYPKGGQLVCPDDGP